MNRKELAILLTKLEGKKEQVNIAQMSEILRLLEALFVMERIAKSRKMGQTKNANYVGLSEKEFTKRVREMADLKIKEIYGKRKSRS